MQVHYKLEITYPDGIHFDTNLKNHITMLDGFSQAKGISGTHNAETFYEVAERYNIIIEQEIESSVKGIKTVEYLIPAKHPQTGLITHYKGNGAETFKKTIYDPILFSDQKMLELGQQPAAKGYQDALKSAKGIADVTVEGVNFRVYVDKKTGMVKNVHPK